MDIRTIFRKTNKLQTYTVIAVLCALGAAAGQTWGQRAISELAALAGSDTTSPDQFGRSVAVDGTLAVIGANYAEVDGAPRVGAAYIFRYGDKGWTEEAKLVASDGFPYDYFGYSVAISGEVVIVGAPFDGDSGNSSGSAYVFRHEGAAWVEEAKLLAADGTIMARFGATVDLDDEFAAIGAKGSAYVFRNLRGSWVQEQKLTPSGGGYGVVDSVAIDGDALVFGYSQDDSPQGNKTGSARVFRYDGEAWYEEAKLTASDATDNARFGCYVDIDGNVILSGAERAKSQDDLSTGAAYVLRFDGAEWIEEAKLLVDDGESGDRFGCSVALKGNVAAIGAELDQDQGEESGSAYVFQRIDGLWRARSKLLPSTGDGRDNFGFSIGLNGEVVVVGAYANDLLGDDSGMAFVFSADEHEDCNNNGILDFVDIAEGYSEDCNENFVPDECDIDDGVSEDCNDNDIPDECDLFVDGVSWDCNHNGVPDECDIADGYSEDVNGDGIPDECFAPGSTEGVVPLLQTRTLSASHVYYDDGFLECSIWETDEATDFGYYDEHLVADCEQWAHGEAGQQSSIDGMLLAAGGMALGGGGDHAGISTTAKGESIYEVTFGVPFTQVAALSGHILTGYDFNSLVEVTLTAPDGEVIFDERIEYVEGDVTFSEDVALNGGLKYTFHARAYAPGGDEMQSAEFDVQLEVLPSSCPADINHDGAVDVLDLLAILSAWGPCEPECPEDVTGDGVVDVLDLLEVLGAWGPCP